MSDKSDSKFLDYLSNYDRGCRYDLILHIIFWASLGTLLLSAPLAQIASFKWHKKEKLYKKVIEAQQEQIKKRDQIIRNLNYSFNHQWEIKGGLK